MAEQKREHYGVFTRKDNDTGVEYEREAHSAGDAVKFTFDGWRQTAEATAKAAKAAAAGPGPDSTGDVAGDSTSTKPKTASK